MTEQMRSIDGKRVVTHTIRSGTVKWGGYSANRPMTMNACAVTDIMLQ